MRFLIDVTFSPEVARRLTELGHDARHLGDLGVAGATDDEALHAAAVGHRVVVTENATDFVPLLDAAVPAGEVAPPVVLVLKRTLPSTPGAMAQELTTRLPRWADDHPDAYRHVHWLP